jgi:predicted Zn-dependent peptidase
MTTAHPAGAGAVAAWLPPRVSSRPDVSLTPSGVRVVSEEMPALRSVAVGIWIGVGSRDEVPETSGLSHFLEHMLFKGTPTRGPREIAELFDGMGGEINAFTGRDHTALFARVLDTHLEHAFEVLADMLLHPCMRDLEQEREVVLEEIAMYEDDPGDLVHDLAAEAIFPEQPLGRPVIGTSAVISSVSAEVVSAHHARHYVAPRIVVAAAGNIGHEQIVELSQRHLSDLGTHDTQAEVTPAVASEPRLLVREKTTEQVHLALAGAGLPRNDERRHALAVVDSILGGSMSSRLFQEVRERRGLAYAVGTYSASYREIGQLGVYLGTREDNLREATDIVARELERIAAEPVPDAELARTKDHLVGRLLLGLESPANRMHRIGRTHLGDGELLSMDELATRVQAVSASDVQEVADEFWRPEKMSVAAIGPSAEVIHKGVRQLSGALAA